MIGIKVQNLIWQKAFLDLLGETGEKYRENQTYDLIISDNPKDAKALILGKDIDLPLTLKMLQSKIVPVPQFENDYFKWLPLTRQLIHKKSQKIIRLTEKESEIIAFLAKQPNHSASRDEILKSVWHYQDDIHTHTLESHIYSLRQKLLSNHDQLIQLKEGICTLIF